MTGATRVTGATRAALVALVAALVVASLAAPLAGTASAEEDPAFEVYVPSPTLEPGTTDQLAVQLVNDRPDPEETAEVAENVRVSLDASGTPFEVRTGRQRVGSLADGQGVDLSFSLSVPYDAPAGTYTLDLQVEYVVDGDENETATVPVEVRIEERPLFAVTDAEADVDVGESGTVSVTVENVGSEPVRDATVQLQSTSGEVTLGGAASASRFAGAIAPGETRTVNFTASVASGADRQSYPLGVTVSYVDADGAPGQSRTLSAGFVPGPEQEFHVGDVESDLEVGREGTLRGTLTNEGDATVEDVVLVIQPGSTSATPRNAEVALGELGPGESTAFEFTVDVPGATEPGVREFGLTVRYRDENGDRRHADELDVTARIHEERDVVEIGGVESDLEVGREGTLAATVTNDRETELRDVVVILQSRSSTVTANEVEVPVGRLAPGEGSEFSFTLDVSGTADAGPRQFDFVVEYRDGEGELRRTDALSVTAPVAESVDTFLVRGVETSVTAGESDTLEVEVTNNREEPLRDVSAKLFVDDPLSVSDDRAFLGTVGPSETATATFSIDAAGSATTKSYPAEVDFQYREPDGDTKLSDTYTVSVEVTEPEDDGLPLPLIAGAALLVVLVAGAGTLLLRRR